MKMFTSTAVLTLSFFAAGFAAQAETELTIDFTYDVTAPALQIYDEIADKAQTSCRDFHRKTTGIQILAVRKRMRKCRAEITDLLVKAIDDPAVSSVHLNSSMPETKLAQSSLFKSFDDQ